MIEVVLDDKPFSYLDRKLGRPDPEWGSKGWVAKNHDGVLTVFHEKPGLSNGVFWCCSGYSRYLTSAEHKEQFKDLAPKNMVQVTVRW